MIKMQQIAVEINYHDLFYHIYDKINHDNLNKTQTKVNKFVEFINSIKSGLRADDVDDISSKCINAISSTTIKPKIVNIEELNYIINSYVKPKYDKIDFNSDKWPSNYTESSFSEHYFAIIDILCELNLLKVYDNDSYEINYTED